MAKHARSNSGTGRPRKRLRLVVELLALVAVCGVLLLHLWSETARREATLLQLEELASKRPHDDAVLALLGGRLAESEDHRDYPLAVSVLERAIRAGADDPAVWQTLAAMNAYVGDVARAASILEHGRENEAGHSADLDAALNRLQALGPGAARSDAARAIAPTGATPLVNAYSQGSCLNGWAAWWGRGHPDKSGFGTRQDWAQQEPNGAEAQRWWGLALLENHRPNAAAHVLAHAADLAPKSAETWSACAQAQEKLGAISDASLTYLKALTIRPNLLEALLGFGRACIHTGLPYAQPAFLRATQLFPASAEAWIWLGRADGGRTSKAIECRNAFEAAERLAPARTDFYEEFGQALVASGDLGSAESHLRRLLAEHPNDAVGHYILGAALMREHQADGIANAEKETRLALSLQPANGDFMRQLGSVLLQEGRKAEAVEALRQVLAVNSADLAACRLLVRAYAGVGLTTQARQLTARTAILFEAEQRINTLMGQSDARFLDPAYHRELERLCRQFGRSASAASERRTIETIRTDPAAVARGRAELRTMVATALGPSVSLEP